MDKETNNKILWEVIRLAVTAIVVFSTVCVAWGVYSQRIIQTEKDIIGIKDVIKNHTDAITSQTVSITAQTIRYEYIRDSLDRIEKKVDSTGAKLDKHTGNN